jgi:hypothetical protein
VTGKTRELKWPVIKHKPTGVERSLRRLGFRLNRTGRTSKIIDIVGEACRRPAMTLAEIESWIGEYIKPGS